VFITPEKYLYVKTAAPLRRLLASYRVSELRLLPEDTFPDRVTYPLVSVIDSCEPDDKVTVIQRSGRVRSVPSTLSASSWLPVVRSAPRHSGAPTLLDISIRISCGVATGADSVFVLDDEDIGRDLEPFAYPTLAGRDVVTPTLPSPTRSMLVPYGRDGELLSEDELGALGEYLRAESIRERLERRTCVKSKPWYAFHENPPLHDVLRPKIMCKDIGAEPVFVIDSGGKILPRHSLYYIVPKDPRILTELAAFLNSQRVSRWLRDHCQRAANGYLRVQSHILKKLPLPPDLHPTSSQLSLLDGETGRDSRHAYAL
ncbi:MAG TPA: TaqI-like C-terminal specificity domain-containing protein, partial [Rhodothermales bacterium]